MSFARHPLQLALGLTVWSAWLVTAYGGLSLACSIAPPAPADGAGTWINYTLALFTAATGLALLWAAWRCWRAPPEPGGPRFIAPVAAALYLAAAIATVFVGLPLARLPPCV